MENEGFVTSAEIFSELVFTGVAEFDEGEDNIQRARGDVQSINLRGIGSAFTLVLLDGRRLAPHPLDQTIGSKPSLLVNANVIPAIFMDRIEILRDGASSIYGTDAIAGVVNSILERDNEGQEFKFRFGWSEQGSFDETTFTYKGGFKFNEGRTNVSLSFNYFDRPRIPNTDRPQYAFPIDHRVRLLANPATERFGLDTSARNVSSRTPYAVLRSLDSDGDGVRVRLLDPDTGKKSTLTDKTGRFHVQPNSRSGARIVDIQPGVSIDDGNISGSLGRGEDGFSERYDFGVFTQLTPAAERKNFFATFDHTTRDGNITFFGDLSYYISKTFNPRAPLPIVEGDEVFVPKQNYWNPLGSITSPNRISVANGFDRELVFSNGDPIPDEGLDLVIFTWRSVDLGAREISVTNESFLGTFGVRGRVGENWSWETAFRYHRNETLDSEANRMNKSGTVEILDNDTSSALNIFGGPGVNEPSDFGVSVLNLTREAETELISWDIRLSSPDAMKLFGNPLGFSVGAELRVETYAEDRDSQIDGTITFDESVNGRSNVIAASFTPDKKNNRNVYGLYAEAIIPLVGEANRMPFIHRLEAHVSGRFEDYDDFGRVSKPKYSGSWYPTEDILLRASFAKGFRAPNLSVLAAAIQRTVTGVEDTYRIEFDEDNPSNDGTFSITDFRGGAATLGPEESETVTAGIVVRIPKFDITLTADYYNVKVSDVITLNSRQDLVDDEADILNDLSFSDFNQSVGEVASEGTEFVTRRNVLQADFDLAQTLDHYPVGSIESVNTSILNEELFEVSGWDFGIEWRLPETPIGVFNLNGTLTYLDTFDEQETAGDTPESDIKDRAHPRVRASASIVWHKGNASASLTTNWMSEVNETRVDVGSKGDGSKSGGEVFVIEDFLRFNSRFSYAFTEGFLKGSRFTFGIRNIGNEDPPFSPKAGVTGVSCTAIAAVSTTLKSVTNSNC